MLFVSESLLFLIYIFRLVFSNSLQTNTKLSVHKFNIFHIFKQNKEQWTQKHLTVILE
jgi:hypothetical protein